MISKDKWQWLGCLCPSMLHSGPVLLWAHFGCLDAWIESCVAASLIIDRACWCLRRGGGLTSACSRLHTSNPLTIDVKALCWPAKQNRLFLKRLWGGTFVDWLQCGRDNRIWRLISKRGLFSPNAVSLISFSLAGEPDAVTTLVQRWKMKRNLMKTIFPLRKELMGCLN